ncbi:signal peptide-containing protein [Theileria equi strain WA]|uniref:Signal peptide-containing protein n=1 Tax=Theileria equi strain WA TaxID=1537102 RepID=L0B095_THEEQ|nr:signal peptide-containing protein [Theileria equi strain WA]AFZ80686.1 signal peptide-containing protein [Theileria equi strain WA]|eukprot:XP_004830352.1 signal peptide-containing protein [Theileria equi strain WA]
MRFTGIFCLLLAFKPADGGWSDNDESGEPVKEANCSSISASNTQKVSAEVSHDLNSARIRYNKSVDVLDDIRRLFNCEVFRAHIGLKNARVALQSATNTLENYKHYLRLAYKRSLELSDRSTSTIKEPMGETPSSNTRVPISEDIEDEFPSAKTQEEIISGALERVMFILKTLDEISELPKLEKKGEPKHKGKLKSLPGLFATSIFEPVEDNANTQKIRQDVGDYRDYISSTDEPDMPLPIISRGSPWNSPSKKRLEAKT